MIARPKSIFFFAYAHLYKSIVGILPVIRIPSPAPRDSRATCKTARQTAISISKFAGDFFACLSSLVTGGVVAKDGPFRQGALSSLKPCTPAPSASGPCPLLSWLAGWPLLVAHQLGLRKKMQPHPFSLSLSSSVKVTVDTLIQMNAFSRCSFIVIH